MAESFHIDIAAIKNTFPEGEGVAFDMSRMTLDGLYQNELDAYRAKRVWRQALSSLFILDPESDFELSVRSDNQSDTFLLTCEFKTACGRYAFWRLTNNQAPEAQSIIEAAHRPDYKISADPLLNEIVVHRPAVLGETQKYGGGIHLLSSIFTAFRRLVRGIISILS